jgi:ATP-binding cassette subfamily B protein
MDKVRWFWQYWRPHWKRMTVIVLLSFVNSAIVVYIPMAMKRAFEFIEAGPGFGGEVERMALLFLGLGVASFVTYATLQGNRAWMNLRLEWAFRQKSFQKMTELGPSFFNKFRTGDLVTRLTDDITEKLMWYSCSGIFRTLEAIIFVVFAVVMMARLNVRLTVYSAAPLALLVIIFIKTAVILEKRFDRLQKKISKVNESLETGFSGIRVIKSYGVEDYTEHRFSDIMEERVDAEIRAVKAWSIIESLYHYVWQFGIVIILLAGGRMVITGDITFGDFVAFDAYVMMLVFPMFDIGQFFVSTKRASVSIARLMEIEAQRPGAENLSAGKDGDPIRGEIEFKNVSFRAPDNGRKIIDSVSFEVPKGTMTALAGPVGSGKTSVINLIPRLVDSSAGNVMLDGRGVEERDLRKLRASIGFVPQDPLLFSDTIEENIRFGRDWIDRDQVQWACDAAQFTKDIPLLSEGLQTVVGQRGVRLSGGQKQRVSLARAIAGRPSLLILDDCTASLDADTEASFWEGLRDYLPDTTFVVISHRPRTLEIADQIVLFDRGEVVAIGNHAELLSESSLYEDLYHTEQLREDVM